MKPAGIGIEIEAPSEATMQDAINVALHAEDRGIDLVVIRETEDPTGPNTIDPWTFATWITASTNRISVAVPDLRRGFDPFDPEIPYPAMLEKGGESLDLLAGTRLVEGVPEPRVVPVASRDEVDRLAALQSAGRSLEPAPRSAAVRSRRFGGIDYDGVPESLRSRTVEPGDASYRSVSSTYLRKGAPGIVLRPRDPSEVADAIAFARRHRHLPLGIRSGGHGISGRSTNNGGLVVDVSSMDTIEVLDTERKLVRIGPGATWKQVAAALDPYGWALGSGDYGGVGVGGLATAGGIGFLSRKYGLTIDHLRAVELVLADGTQVRATHHENPGLFWAARGAGANFGIATAFEFEVHDLGEVGWAQLALVTNDISVTLRLYGQLATTAPRDTTVFLVTGRPRQRQSVVQLFAMVTSDDPEVVVDRLTPFTGLGLVADQEVVIARYADVMALAADVGPEGQQGWGEPVSRSAFLPTLTDEFAHDAADLLHGGEVYFFQLRSMGGAIADVAPEETAFAHRTPAFQVTAMGVDQNRLNAAWDNLAGHFDGLYHSFDTDLGPDRLGDAFPPATLRRLRELKRRYDPTNLFRDNFNIDPGDHDHV